MNYPWRCCLQEAVEVSEFNDWFVYGEPLHRLREFGVPIKEYFAVDYKKFSHDQMKGLIALFFGLELASLPSPKTQWPAFLAMVNNINNTTGMYTYVLNVSTRQVSHIYTTSSPVTIIIRMLSLSRLFSTDTSHYDHSSFPLIHLSINISSAS